MKLLTHDPKINWSQEHGYPAINEGVRGFYPECLVCNGYGTIYKYCGHKIYGFVDCPNCDGLGWANFLIITGK